jgi:hypothetical protein
MVCPSEKCQCWLEGAPPRWRYTLFSEPVRRPSFTGREELAVSMAQENESHEALILDSYFSL